jgi:hypothetical protein
MLRRKDVALFHTRAITDTNSKGPESVGAWVFSPVLWTLFTPSCACPSTDVDCFSAACLAVSLDGEMPGALQAAEIWRRELASFSPRRILYWIGKGAASSRAANHPWLAGL